MVHTIQVEINGTLKEISKKNLFELAKKGVIQPDTRLIVGERTTVAKKVAGIEFAAPVYAVETPVLEESFAIGVSPGNPFLAESIRKVERHGQEHEVSEIKKFGICACVGNVADIHFTRFWTYSTLKVAWTVTLVMIVFFYFIGLLPILVFIFNPFMWFEAYDEARGMTVLPIIFGFIWWIAWTFCCIIAICCIRVVCEKLLISFRIADHLKNIEAILEENQHFQR